MPRFSMWPPSVRYTLRRFSFSCPNVSHTKYQAPKFDHSRLAIFEKLESLFGLASQYPRRILSTDKLKVRTLMVFAPIFADAAAPDVAIAVARPTMVSTCSNARLSA